MGELIKCQHNGPCGDGNVLCVYCIHASILSVMPYDSFTKCSFGRNWIKGTQGLPALFLTTACEFIIISKLKF